MNSRGEERAGLRCFLTLPHECGYLPSQQAVSLVVDPETPMDRRLYTHLVQKGFRRSGDTVYRPCCPACDACISLRVDADAFRPNRSQRRVQRRNADLVCLETAPVCDEEHFALYAGYLAARHAGGGMDSPTPDSYRRFLFASHQETLFLDFRLDGRLVCTTVLDVLEDGLSAVYTFFEPTLKQRGLGVLAILEGLAGARGRGLRWLYLGYWIAACRRMAYKSRFRPYQIYRGGRWESVSGAGSTTPTASRPDRK